MKKNILFLIAFASIPTAFMLLLWLMTFCSFNLFDAVHSNPFIIVSAVACILSIIVFFTKLHEEGYLD